MLTVRYEGLKPKEYSKPVTVIIPGTGAIAFRLIPFDIENFLKPESYKKFGLWCLQRNYGLSSGFVLLPTAEEYWSVQCLFSGGTIDLEFTDKSFSSLIAEVENFIKECC